MRFEVTIPDPLFAGAQRAAAANGLSLEAYVTDAVQLRLQDEPSDDMAWFFTPDRVMEIREAAAEARTGNNLTPEQVEAHFAAKKAAWLETHPA
jgi:hypothetical protein